MPFIRFLVSVYYTCVVILIFSLGEIMPIYSCCAEKKLIYITIAALFSCQPSFYFKYTKLNIHLSYNI